MISLLSNAVSYFFQRKSMSDEKRNHVFYKIVDSVLLENDVSYTIQCINTKTIFYATVSEMIVDSDILYGLHPLQACFVGIEYAKVMNTARKISIKNMTDHYPKNRYGKYVLRSQDRAGQLIFEDKQTQQWLSLDPKDLVLSKEIIAEFDASDAFYIGICAGLKLKRPEKSFKPQLHVVK